jgi:hypothetical protein
MSSFEVDPSLIRTWVTRRRPSNWINTVVKTLSTPQGWRAENGTTVFVGVALWSPHRQHDF